MHPISMETKCRQHKDDFIRKSTRAEEPVYTLAFLADSANLTCERMSGSVEFS